MLLSAGFEDSEIEITEESESEEETRDEYWYDLHEQ